MKRFFAMALSLALILCLCPIAGMAAEPPSLEISIDGVEYESGKPVKGLTVDGNEVTLEDFRASTLEICPTGEDDFVMLVLKGSNALTGDEGEAEAVLSVESETLYVEGTGSLDINAENAAVGLITNTLIMNGGSINVHDAPFVGILLFGECALRNKEGGHVTSVRASGGMRGMMVEETLTINPGCNVFAVGDSSLLPEDREMLMMRSSNREEPCVGVWAAQLEINGGYLDAKGSDCGVLTMGGEEPMNSGASGRIWIDENLAVRNANGRPLEIYGPFEFEEVPCLTSLTIKSEDDDQEPRNVEEFFENASQTVVIGEMNGSYGGPEMPMYHPIRATAGAGGKITFVDNQKKTITASENLFVQGKIDQLYTIVPDKGYLISSVLVDRKPVTLTADNGYVFGLLYGVRTIDVTFQKDANAK